MPESNDELTLEGSMGSSLQLSPGGFTMIYALGRSHFGWTDVDGDFKLTQPLLSMSRAMAFDLIPSYRATSRLRVVYAVQKLLFGYHAAIGQRSSKLGLDELADVLNEWRGRFAGSRGGDI